MPTVQQVLASNDPVKCGEILLILLAEAASGKEISNTVAEVVQVLLTWNAYILMSITTHDLGLDMTQHALASHWLLQGIFRGKWAPQIKKLAYDLVQACPVSDADVQFVITGMKVRLVQLSAVSCASHLPCSSMPCMLTCMLDTHDALCRPMWQATSLSMQYKRCASCPTFSPISWPPCWKQVRVRQCSACSISMHAKLPMVSEHSCKVEVSVASNSFASNIWDIVACHMSLHILSPQGMWHS